MNPLRLAYTLMWIVVIAAFVFCLVRFLRGESLLVPGLVLLTAYWSAYSLRLVHRNRRLSARVLSEGRDPQPTEVDRMQAADPVTRQDIEKRTLRSVLAITASLALTGVALASLLFEWEAVLLGALGLSVILLFFGAPAWIAIVREEGDEELERHGYRSRAIR